MDCETASSLPQPFMATGQTMLPKKDCGNRSMRLVNFSMMESFLCFGKKPTRVGKCIAIHSAATEIQNNNMTTKNQFSLFKSLHESGDPLVIANAWNAQSARVFEKLNYKAIATSSAAVAETLGFADGEQMN